MAGQVKRIAFLFSRLSGYMSACLKTLKDLHNVELLVIRIPPVSNAPFDEAHFNWIESLYDRNALSTNEMLNLVKEFQPQGIYLSGWGDKGYLSVARQCKSESILRVAGSDTQWTGSLRQRVGSMIAPWMLHSAVDVMWVPGERQKQLANKLGFNGSKCWNSGDYSCDWHQFATAYSSSSRQKRGGFLYVGRYIPVKGIDVLIKAYQLYYNDVSDPWPLICAGTGELSHLLKGIKGIEDRGFVQPDQLPALMSEASAFVLPSRYEPWGVVIHEAATAGLPVLSSDASGAAVHLVQDGFNGFVFESGNAVHLAEKMKRLTRLSEDSLTEMGDHSHLLSKQFTPERWANTLAYGIYESISHATAV